MTNRRYNSNRKSNNNKQPRERQIKENISEIQQYIIGQDEQIKKIVTALYRAINFRSIKSNLLIVGGSGTGKTETIKQIARRMHIPYTIEDATKYTQEGYHGADVNLMIYNLIEKAGNDWERAQNGIIIVDEIDKKVSKNSGEAISSKGVLNSLLKIIEGSRIKIPGRKSEFDTRNVIVIFMGAFDGLENIRENRLGVNKLGFSTTIQQENSKKTPYLKSDLIKFGLSEEFMGRIDTIVEMNKLYKNDLVQILKRSRLSIFSKYINELKKYKITVEYEEALLERIAEKALELSTGARELNTVVNYIFEDIIYEVFANCNKYEKCRLTNEIVNDNKKYELS